MEWDFDDDDFKSNAPAERELVPEGPHEFRIERAAENPERFEVALVHDDRRYSWVWARMPKAQDWGRRLGSDLRKALGMTREEWALAAIDDMVGRRVVAEVYHRVGGNGTTYVNVSKFAAPAAAAPRVERAVAPSAGRTPVRTPAKEASSDDIPF